MVLPWGPGRPAGTSRARRLAQVSRYPFDYTRRADLTFLTMKRDRQSRGHRRGSPGLLHNGLVNLGVRNLPSPRACDRPGEAIEPRRPGGAPSTSAPLPSPVSSLCIPEEAATGPSGYAPSYASGAGFGSLHHATITVHGCVDETSTPTKRSRCLRRFATRECETGRVGTCPPRQPSGDMLRVGTRLTRSVSGSGARPGDLALPTVRRS